MKFKRIHMRKLITLTYILLGLFLASPALIAQNQAKLKVMTWNIRLDTPDDGINQWQFRRDGLCNELSRRKPDVFGVQEAKYNQMTDMRKRLKGYKGLGVGRDDGNKGGEFSAIFYNKRVVKPVRSGTFWLSETPDIPGSRGWDAACNRVVTWAEFSQKATGKHFVMLNTHFDHMGEEARVQSALLIIRKLKEIAGKLPIVLTGDLNVTPKHKAYRILTFSENEYTLSDTRVRADARITGPDFSFTGFDPAFTPSELIDFILVTWDFKVISNEIYDFRYNGKYLSDHLPVVAELELTGK
ncbi:MAG: endonuclease/exonuclease/phosphatase family protein [Bacteroidota bacterium]